MIHHWQNSVVHLLKSGLVLLLLALSCGAAVAQHPAAKLAEAPKSETDLQQIIDSASKQGVRVIVVEPKADDQLAPEPARRSLFSRMSATTWLARQRLFEILAGIPSFPALALKAIQSKGESGSAFWPFSVAAIAIVFLLIGWVGRHLFYRWARRVVLSYFSREPVSDAEKIGYLYTRGVVGFAGLAIQVVVAVLLVLAVDPGKSYRDTAMIVVAYWGVVAGFSIFFRTLLAIDAPQYRTVAISHERAKTFYQELTALFAFAMFVIAACYWMDGLGIDPGAHVLALSASSLIGTLVLSAVAVRYRRDVAQMLFSGKPYANLFFWQKVVARFWYVPIIVYLLAAWAFTATRLLLDQPNAIGLVGFPVLFALAAVALYGAYLLLVEAIFERRPLEPEKSAASAGGMDGASDREGASEAAQELEVAALLEPPTYKRLAQRAGAMLAVVGVVAATLALWGTNPLAQSGSTDAIVDILIVVFVAYLCWSATKIAIDRRIMHEGGPVSIIPGEVGGGGSSRLGTLLPLFSNFLLIFIASVAIMIILMELGVNVTPLFAGAGIVGLAIGFGAQTLVRDILSGVFFLIDDAFRQGEYIDVGDVKGTVETISLRSMQLRHHLGPLNTIPFGEIKNVQNFSRDWVIMKLPLRLTYDTDAEKVRKLINRFGKELLEDPQIGQDFLQPLKSQGVTGMDESAMIMRVKFMTKPGQQWLIRRKVLNGIRDLFDREGIIFAHHEVTVRVASDRPDEEISEGDRAAAGAAGQRIAAERAQQKPAAALQDEI
ncbi:MAG: mechanosensitive ion channel family protein [Hyphomicrobiaceae bacterium]